MSSEVMKNNCLGVRKCVQECISSFQVMKVPLLPLSSFFLSSPRDKSHLQWRPILNVIIPETRTLLWKGFVCGCVCVRVCVVLTFLRCAAGKPLEPACWVSSTWLQSLVTSPESRGRLWLWKIHAHAQVELSQVARQNIKQVFCAADTDHKWCVKIRSGRRAANIEETVLQQPLPNLSLNWKIFYGLFITFKYALIQFSLSFYLVF